MNSIDLWYTTRAIGIVALVLLSATTVLGLLAAGRARGPEPGYARVALHRNLSLLTSIFLVLHIATTLLDTYVHVNWLSVVLPFTSSYHRTFLALGTVGVDAFLAVALTSAVRGRIPARVWRTVHWAAYLSWPVAVSHSLGMGTDRHLSVMLGLVTACVVGVLGTGTWRLITFRLARARVPQTAIRARRSLVEAARAKGALS